MNDNKQTGAFSIPTETPTATRAPLTGGGAKGRRRKLTPEQAMDARLMYHSNKRMSAAAVARVFEVSATVMDNVIGYKGAYANDRPITFKPFFTFATGETCGNAQVFATYAEAENSARDRFMRWTMPTGFEVRASDEPVNYRWTREGGDERI